MFGKTVLEIPGEVFGDALTKAKSDKGTANDLDLDVADQQALVQEFKRQIHAHSGSEFPQHPDPPHPAPSNPAPPVRSPPWRNQP